MRAPKYTIRTVQDFLAVPEDRRALCLSEFMQWLGMAQNADALRAMLGALGAELKNDPFEAFYWVDDDKGEAHIDIREDGKDDALVEFSLPLAKGEA